MLATVAFVGLDFFQTDVQTALLDGDLSENIYMNSPMFVRTKKNQITSENLKKSFTV